MDWQRHVLDVALELIPHVDAETGELTHRFAYRSVVLTVPRQSGKTTLMLVLMLTRALGSERANIRFAMQSYVEAQGKLVDEWLPELDDTPLAGLYKPRFTNGEHGLKFPETGSVIKIMSSTKTAGHGTSKLSLAILDEAFAQKDARFEQAMSPAMSTQAGRSQMWYVSTAGPMDGSAEWFKAKCETGRLAVRVGTDTELAYFEWSAEEDDDPTDPDTWRRCMPALGITQEESFIAAEAESMRDEMVEFRRAYLNQWTTTLHQPIIDLREWQSLAVEAEPEITGGVALSFDVTPGSSWASIAGVSLADGKAHLDLIAHEPGTDWIAPRLQELVSTHQVSTIVYDPSSPAAAVVGCLSHPDVRRKLLAAQTRDFGEACQLLFSSVASRSIAHGDQPEILAALDGAGKRSNGDLWRWSRTSTSVDISPLVAVTLALWGYERYRPREPVVWDIGAMMAELDEEANAKAA